ncbi:MAG: efflux RND transporter periplasmic adaptor subunit [Bacteroidota bacterium]|nr:efflux RND transporter periplasmic adaptor subunit [Bacteroidota bacterium]
MKTLKYLSLVIATCILLFGISCNSRNKKSTVEATKVDSTNLVLVKTSVIKKESINRIIEFTASLIPFEEVHLAPSAPGRIEKIYVEVSDNVKQGQVVACMDRTNLEQARINLMKIKADFKRLDTLKKTRSIADQQYDQMKSAYEIAQNTYQSLLENTQLKAPFSGVVSGKYFENGEIYSGSPVQTIGKPAILSIVQINSLKALIGISSSYYPVIRTGMKADVKADLYPNMTFQGEIFRIYPTIDNATKTFSVEMKIKNDNLKLRPGMFAKITLDLGKGEAIMVPTISLIKQTGTNDMYLFLNKNNKAVKQPVQIGRIIDDKTEILNGVNEGDEIVIVGQNKLEDKSSLRIVR